MCGLRPLAKGSGKLFVKMAHNGIEYGVMTAYAEGLGVLRDANVGKRDHAVDAKTSPLRDPEHYRYDFNLRDIAEVWRRGSVIVSRLLDLTAAALVKDSGLSEFQGRVSDSGEGRWTITPPSTKASRCPFCQPPFTSAHFAGLTATPASDEGLRAA